MLGSHVNLPWMITGDSNEVADTQEKRGRRPTNRTRCNRFVEMINNCQLMDLGFEGSRFTWQNSRSGLATIRERLDRSMANNEWRTIPHTHSDHHPILTCCDGIITPLLTNRFRFELAWTTHPNCEDIIRDIRNSSTSVYETLNRVPEIMLTRNRNTFVNI